MSARLFSFLIQHAVERSAARRVAKRIKQHQRRGRGLSRSETRLIEAANQHFSDDDRNPSAGSSVSTRSEIRRLASKLTADR